MAPFLSNNLSDEPHPSDPMRGLPAAPPGFAINEFIGEGGFGRVWRGETPGGIPCALKFIPLTSQVRAGEARAVRKMVGVRFPHLVGLKGIWFRDPAGNVLNEDASTATELVMAMDLGTGTLLNVLKKYREKQGGGAGIPPGELLDYMEQAAKAIDFLNSPIHELKDGSRVAIYHCDIKPENILTTQGGGIWVCDFGIARFRRPAGMGQSIADHRLGLTLQYAPPELIQPKSDDYSAEDYKNTDQYSLAVTFYHLRTGALPFLPEDSAAPLMMAVAHLNGRLDFSRVSEAEQEILRRATTRQQEARFPSAGEMIGELRDALSTRTRGGKPPRQRRAESTGEIPIPSRVWLPREGLEVVPGYRLRMLRPVADDTGETWDADGPDGAPAVIQIAWPIAGDPEPICEALDRLKAVRHEGMAELLDYWFLDGRGHVVPRQDSDGADALVIASRTRAFRSLYQRLEEVQSDIQAGIPQSELLPCMQQAAATLDFLHGAGLEIQHGSIWPESLLLLTESDGNPRVILSHFSSARIVSSSRVAVPREPGGSRAIYRPPESIRGERTNSCDQYGLAVAYYHLRTGRPPRAADSAAYLMLDAIRRGDPGLDDLPPAERLVIERATDRVPSKRFTTCVEMVRALAECPECHLNPPPRRDPDAPRATIVPRGKPVADDPPPLVSYPTLDYGDTGRDVIEEIKVPPRPTRPDAKLAPSNPDWELPLDDSLCVTTGPEEGTRDLDELPVARGGTRRETDETPEESAAEAPTPAKARNKKRKNLLVRILVPISSERAGKPWSRVSKVRDIVIRVTVFTVVVCMVVLAIPAFVPEKVHSPGATVQSALRDALQAVAAGDFATSQDRLKIALVTAQEHDLPSDRIAAVAELVESARTTSSDPGIAPLKDFADHIRKSSLDENDRQPFEALRDTLASAWAAAEVLGKANSIVLRERGALDKVLALAATGLEVEPGEPIRLRLTALQDAATRAKSAQENTTAATLQELTRASRALTEDDGRERFRKLRDDLAGEKAGSLVAAASRQVGANAVDGAKKSLESVKSLYPFDNALKARADRLEAVLKSADALARQKDPEQWDEAKNSFLAVADAKELTGDDRQNLKRYIAAQRRPEVDEERLINAALEKLKNFTSDKAISAALDCLGCVRKEHASNIKTLLEKAQILANEPKPEIIGEIRNEIKQWNNRKDEFAENVKGAHFKKIIDDREKEILMGVGDRLERQWQAHLTAVVARMVPGLPKEGAIWDDLYSLSGDDNANVWIRAFRAEYLVRRSDKSRTAIDGARAGLAKLSEEDIRNSAPETVDNLRSYVAFVQAKLAECVADDETKPADKKISLKAAAEYALKVNDQAYRAWPPHRLSEIRDLLARAVKFCRQPRRAVVAFSPTDAADVEGWSARAIALAGVTPEKSPESARQLVELQAYRILAFCSIPEKSRDLAGAAVEAADWTAAVADNGHLTLLEDYVDRFSVSVVYGLGRPADTKKRLEGYRQAWETFREAKGAIDRKDLYRFVLAPIRPAGEEIPKSVVDARDGVEHRSAVAGLYVAMADDIRTHPKEWATVLDSTRNKDEQFATVAALYKASEELEKSCVEQSGANEKEAAAHRRKQSEYIVRRVDECLARPSADLEALRKSAEDAISLAPEYSGGHSLKWVLLTLLVSAKSDHADRVKLLEAARKDFDLYLSRLPNDATADLRLLHRCRSRVYVQLGNWDPKNKEYYLREAGKSAESIPEDERSSDDWLSIGNAREDIAWLLGDIASYQLACDAFTRACKSESSLASGLLSRGRSRLKWSEAEKDPKRIENAVEDLQKAAVLAGVPIQKAEAFYWQGRCGALCRRLPGGTVTDFEHADKAYSRAWEAATAPDASPSDWPETIQRDWTSLCLQEAKTNPDSLEAVERHADLLGKYNPVTAAYYRGRALILRGKNQDALREFAKGLAVPGRDQDRDTVREIHMERLGAWLAEVDKETLKEALKDATAAESLALASHAKDAELAKIDGRAGLVAYKVWYLENGAENSGEESLKWLTRAIAHDKGATHNDAAVKYRTLAANLLWKVRGDKDAARKMARDAIGCASDATRAAVEKEVEPILRDGE